MRCFFTLLICKLIRFAGKLLGRGSSLPGMCALFLCPDILSRLTLPKYILAVTGSNGKTSTVEMIAAILEGSGKSYIYNKEGSNQIEGITTLLISHATLRGVIRQEVLLLECDERYAKYTFQAFHPTHFVITNLYRDQLSRNGHPRWVYQDLEKAVFDDTTLLLNADDPLVSCFAQHHEKVLWFGLNDWEGSTKTHRGVYHDGLRCPLCNGRLEYSLYHYSHVGYYRCAACGHHRHDPDFAVTDLSLKEGRLTLDHQTEISLCFKSIYNVYNILAAYSVCRTIGVEADTIQKVINHYILKNGRMVEFRLGQHHGTLLVSKHENSVSYDSNLRYIEEQGEDCTVLVIVDEVSRKYFTGETSWLWDIDFDRLAAPNVKAVYLMGQYRHDLSLRFAFSEVPPEKVLSCTIEEGTEVLRSTGSEPLFVVTCFSDKEKFLSKVERL